MRNSILFSSLFSLIFLAFPGFAQSCPNRVAQAFNWKDCSKSTIQAYERLQGDVSVRDAGLATRNLTEFSLAEVEKTPKLGYSTLRYRLLEQSGVNAVQLSRKEANFAERSLLDWMKRIFVAENSTYLVSVDVYVPDQTEADGQRLVAHTPIFSVINGESFKTSNNEVDINYNGQIGFPRKSDEKLSVEINVRQAKSTTVTTEELKKLFGLAQAVAEPFANASSGGVASLVDGTLTTSVDGLLDQIDTFLGEFEAKSDLSQQFQLSKIGGEYDSALFDFFAPGIVYKDPLAGVKAGRIKLKVYLDYQESLLAADKSYAFGDIVAKKIHFSGTTLYSLNNFLVNHLESRDQWGARYNPDRDLGALCRSMGAALRSKLIARDVYVATSALVATERAAFQSGWDATDCYGADGFTFMAEGYKMVDPTRAAQAPVTKTELSFEAQKALPEKLTTWLRGGLASEFADDVSGQVADKMAEEVSVLDADGLFFGSPGVKVEVAPGSLIRLLLAKDRGFLNGHGFGCYNGNLYDYEEFGNDFGSLAVVNGRTMEFIWRYREEAASTSDAWLEELVVRELDSDTLSKYNLKSSGEVCGGKNGFNPWSYQAETVALNQ
ncbi:hypothetical protein [Meridianimarinicoccus aquatilis]|uniref:Uncharacterized protein n=1 Tax=Meridianimarinicoccus aquatilis TaxID=2552766 RepID=A0A4V3BB16_9RHOB|nr:hypothetical protein [Fluviibacterium aquatile]TDL85419.1 hypothetical protein E2L05_15640 [Fluviibacterium aquatile]